MGFTRFHPVLLSFNGFYKVSFGFTMFSEIFTGLKWV